MSGEMVFLMVDEVLSSRILIISNSEEAGTAFEKMLHHEGFESVSKVRSISESIMFLRPHMRESSLPIDLIIFESGDLGEKNIDEIWKAKETFDLLDIPMVVVGNARYSDELVELIETGGVDYIQEPIDQINLIARIKTILNLCQANRKLKKHHCELTELTNELEEKNRRLNSILEDIRFDLKLAGDLQRSFLPSGNINGETVDFAFFYQPCETIGGDLINVIPVSAKHFIVYLLDVSGHGVSAALLAFAIHRHLSSEANFGLIRKKNGRIRSPAEVCRILNQDFLMHNEWYRYFTITYGIYNAGTRIFKYCRAGQTPLLLMQEEAAPQLLRHGCPPIGLSANAIFVEDELKLKPGDRIFLYSDGITEAVCNNEDFFGEEKLIKELSKSKTSILQDQINRFTRRFFTSLGNNRPRDDIALLGMLIK